MKKAKAKRHGKGIDLQKAFPAIILVAAVAAASMLATGYYMPKYRPAEPGSTDCITASECVPAQCCHPTECINRMVAPDCEGVACTEECRPGTMDCGQGSCDCIDSKCTAVIDGW